MKRSEFIGEFDLDAVLTELSVDLDIRVTRRMLAGACIVAETMRFFGAQRLIVADCGLRHALAQEMLRKNEK